MCNCVKDRNRLIKEVKDKFNLTGERWAVIKNRSNRLEIIPEKSLEGLTNIKLIFKN